MFKSSCILRYIWSLIRLFHVGYSESSNSAINVFAPEFKELTTTISKGFLKAYKNRVKGKLFELKSKGDKIEWVPDNFSINNIPGLRKFEWL